MKAFGLAFLSVLLGLTVAFATPTPGVGQEGPQEESARVVVQNRTGSDAHIYALQKGHMVPLGVVRNMENTTMTLPATLAQLEPPIQFIADLIGTSAWYKSDPVHAHQATEVEFTLESDLDQSAVRVRG